MHVRLTWYCLMSTKASVLNCITMDYPAPTCREPPGAACVAYRHFRVGISSYLKSVHLVLFLPVYACVICCITAFLFKSVLTFLCPACIAVFRHLCLVQGITLTRLQFDNVCHGILIQLQLQKDIILFGSTTGSSFK